MKKIELLSPVGGYEQFIAAVECGADAVYLGGASFNARNSAANFSDEELKQVIAYAHVRGVKVHLTLNTLIHDYEMHDVIEFAKKAYSYGVDAFIVQDLGVIRLLREVIPEVTIHFSTQGTIYSANGVKALDSLNFERVVLSRELSLDEIENVCQNTDREIEVFVHGALCVCYSGQCRLSSLVGERSGNRGKCAQPCRLQYTIYKDDEKRVKSYCMSPKDLCGINDLIRLIKAGVSSLKIEGRLKSPEYVACVTSIYRKYIDLAYELIEKGEEDKYKVDEKDIENLAQVFNRGGFSKGYYHGKLGKDLICRARSKHWGTYLGKVLEYDKRKKLVKVRLDNGINMGDGIEIVNETLPGNVVTYIERDNKQIKEAQKGDIVYLGDIAGLMQPGESVYKISDKKLNTELKKFTDGKYYRKLLINMKLIGGVGEKLKLSISDNDGNLIEKESEFIPEEAINRPITAESVRNSLGKLGDTPFELNELEFDVKGNCLVPNSVLNELRRDLAEELEEKRSETDRVLSEKNYKNTEKIDKEVNSKLSVYLYNVKNLEGLELADRVYVPIKDYSGELCDKLRDKEVIPYLNTVTKNSRFSLDNVNKVLVGNPEHLVLAKGKEVFADFSLNVFNSYACEELEELGVKGINLSFELNLEEIKGINTNLEKEVTVYGRLPVMISEHCPIGSEIAGKINCNLCQKNQYYLEDRVGVKFPIITERGCCRSTLLNGKILFVPETVGELRGKVDYFRAYFFDETSEERRRILELLKIGEKTTAFGYTSGHFYRGV